MIFEMEDYTAEVHLSFSGGEHTRTTVDVFKRGPRDGKRYPAAPTSIEGLAAYGRLMERIALHAVEVEAEQLAAARASGVLR